MHPRVLRKAARKSHVDQCQLVVQPLPSMEHRGVFTDVVNDRVQVGLLLERTPSTVSSSNGGRADTSSSIQSTLGEGRGENGGRSGSSSNDFVLPCSVRVHFDIRCPWRSESVA